MVDNAALRSLVDYWRDRQGGAERANYQLFLGQLARALGVPEPDAASGGTLGDYQFEGPVLGGARGGGTGFIDLYKRNCFILEAKQSKLPPAQQAELSLFDPDVAAPATPAGARYDKLMRDARRQAEQYAHSLPGSHAPVPFLIVCDVGRAFELYFDYSGNGRGYGFFPDKRHYRISLAELTSDAIIPAVDRTPADLLRAIWTDPRAVDPRARSADVTRDVARKLAQVSLHLEQEGRIELKRRGVADAAHEAELVEGTALFLMRILFCMFAEDVGLLPRDKFKNFLESCALPHAPDNPGRLIDSDLLRRGLIDLWEKMGAPDLGDRWTWVLGEPVRYFNGGLFESKAVFPLARNDLDSLIDAARHRWSKVEPAIFGTLLEQALGPADRAKLGAHYTPRPYVERLVQATITDVLAPEWAAAQDEIERLRADGDEAAAIARAQDFLAYLQRQRVLDPACGTGNFLYVAMETLLRLESDVIETIAALGGDARPAIGPENFLGLELNPRAAVIAELVLWIGWLRWRTANDPTAVPDPVLQRTNAINFGGHHGYDAILARDKTGEVAQPPRQAEWPEAEFIVGNPPFIGGKDIRSRLGSTYAEALWKANPGVPPSADFVMQWWGRAAGLLTLPETPLRRFGFVTTNSITQGFSRRVIAEHLSGERPLSLVMGCADQPWTRASKDSAAVRIAQSVAVSGVTEGRLLELEAEADLDTDMPSLAFSSVFGPINSDLTIGPDVTECRPLQASAGLVSAGVKLHGKGFIIRPDQVAHLGIDRREGLARHIREYRNGRDIQIRPRNHLVLDMFGLTENQLLSQFPEVFDYLWRHVKDVKDKDGNQIGRDGNPRQLYRNMWWLFGEPRADMRPALDGLHRYIVTVETSKHRIFQFLDASVLPDNKLTVFALNMAYDLGVLTSRAHLVWYRRNAGMIGVFNEKAVYVKASCFDPFPFPDPTADQRIAIADLAEELDATRKAAIAEHPRLTMTGLYNLVEKLRTGAALTPAEETDARDARARIVLHLHEQLDRAVAEAYGWPHDLAPAEIVARLVALNAERAAEEAAGHVRWLRPDYQIPRFAEGVARRGRKLT
jgi:hypothetical protein